MNISDYRIKISDNIIIVTSKLKMNLDVLSEVKELFENTSLRFYRYGMYTDTLGYYHGYDFIKKRFIYCGSMSYPEALKLMNKYIETNEQDMGIV